MPKKPSSRLSVGELEVLEVLWRYGPVSLSEAHEQWGKPIGYTCLLYTSPSPRDLSTSRMPSSA